MLTLALRRHSWPTFADCLVPQMITGCGNIDQKQTTWFANFIFNSYLKRGFWVTPLFFPTVQLWDFGCCLWFIRGLTKGIHSQAHKEFSWLMCDVSFLLRTLEFTFSQSNSCPCWFCCTTLFPSTQLSIDMIGFITIWWQLH